MQPHFPQRIVSGGQTGADRGALEVAIARGIPHGGWCPLGRRSEDGPIPLRFQLQETESEIYAVRTRWNIRDSDATLLLTRGEPTGGSALTAKICLKMNKPLLHLDIHRLSEAEAIAKLRLWLSLERPDKLNVAGSRESQCHGIAAATRAILGGALTHAS